MIHITSHVLDTGRGIPAQGVAISLFLQHHREWVELGRNTTDADGRVSDLMQIEPITGFNIYKIKFDTKAYFDQLSVPSFYPVVEIIFEAYEHGRYHIPLLLNPFGYTTYRGS